MQLNKPGSRLKKKITFRKPTYSTLLLHILPFFSFFSYIANSLIEILTPMEATELIKDNGNAEVDAGDTKDNVRNTMEVARVVESDENAKNDQDDNDHNDDHDTSRHPNKKNTAISTKSNSIATQLPVTQTSPGLCHGNYILVMALYIIWNNPSLRNVYSLLETKFNSVREEIYQVYFGKRHIENGYFIETVPMKHHNEKERRISLITSPGLYYMVWSSSMLQNSSLSCTTQRQSNRIVSELASCQKECSNSNGFPLHKGNLQ